MEWVTLGIVIGVALWTYFKMPKIPKVTQKPGEVECPICEDGAPIPVLFGTGCIRGANATWWGGVETDTVQYGENDGRLVYYISMRMQLCHGTTDRIVKVFVGEKDLQLDPITSDQRVQITRTNILGGGAAVSDLVGKAYFRMGAPNSVLGNNAGVYSKPSEVNGETDGLGPGFFGVACVELERMRVGGSPYLQPWAFVVQRINYTNAPSPSYGTVSQWRLPRSSIPHGIAAETKWSFLSGSGLTVPTGDMDLWTANLPSDEAPWWGPALMPFGVGSPPTGLPAISDDPEVQFGWPAGQHLWARTTVYSDPLDSRYFNKVYLFVYCENAAWVWIDGHYVGSTNATNATQNGSSANFDVTEQLRPAGFGTTTGQHTITLYCLDEDPAEEPDSTYVYARVVTAPVVDNNIDAATLYSYRDMNPAHIIRECLTDPVWGMGYLDADIDDTSFIAASDALYAERFGMSIMWSEPGSIEDFINEILRHINGTLYVDRLTGKYKLTLVREDYDTDDLVSLDESSIERIDDVNRRATGDLVNQVSVSYTSSAMGDAATVTITEPGLVQLQGAVISKKLEFPGITTHELASRVALRELKALSSPLLSCTIIASRQAATLNPGDAFKATWSEYGMSNLVMRVATIELGDGRSNGVRIKCVEDVFASPEDNVLAPPATVWEDPTAVPQPIPDPVFVDTYNYKSTFLVAKLGDSALHSSVDAVFCYVIGGGSPLPTIFNQRVNDNWEEIRTGVWRAKHVGQAFMEQHLNGVTAFFGMRVLCAWLAQDAEIEGTDLEAEDKPRTGIYTVTNPGFLWDEETRTYTSTYAQLERAPDFANGSQLESGCVVAIGAGFHIGSEGTVTFAGKYGNLTTSAPITLGTTALEWELLSSYSPVRGDNLLTEAQAQVYGDDVGATVNLSATSAAPSEWMTFPTLVGTPNAQTYPAGRTRWKFLASLDLGDTSATTTIECQIVKYVDINNVTVLAEAESDPIAVGDGYSPHIWWDEYVTHDDVNSDQTLGGGRLAVRYRLVTTSAGQVVVSFKYGSNLYLTRVDTPLTLGAIAGFPHTPYGDAIPLDANGILTIPDMDLCSGEIRVSGADFKGVSITDGTGKAFVGGDKLSIRLTENCYIHHNETVASGAAGLNLSTSGGLEGTDADKDAGPRSQIVLQYDDLVGKWEVVGQPTIMEKTA